MAKLRLQNKLQQELTKRQYLGNQVLSFAEKKDFNRALDCYKLMNPTGADEKKIKSLLLCKITTEFTRTDIENMLSIFNINIKTFRFEFQACDSTKLLLTATPIIMDLIHNNWINNSEKAKSLLDYFIKQGLPLQSNQSYNNALMHVLMKCPDNLDFIKRLLVSGHIDINTVITSKTDQTCKIIKTPFSIAFGKLSEELLILLLTHGADPYLAIKLARNEVESKYGKGVDFRVSSGLNVHNMSDIDKQEYVLRVDNLIDKFFLDKLIQEPLLRKQKSAASLSKTEISTKKEKKISSLDTDQVTKTLDEYISYKEQASENTDLSDEKREEHKFDTLFLQYCKDSSELNLQNLHEFIEDNPHLHHYSINTLLNKTANSDVAQDILMQQPKLLHKFFTLKKKLYDSTPDVASNPELPTGVYKVKVSDKFQNNIYITMTSPLKDQLQNYPAFKEKVEKSLPDCKFIKLNSRGETGIKTYKGIIKFKVIKENFSLSTGVKYVDKSTGDVFIIFDTLTTHDDQTNNHLKVEKLPNFAKIWTSLKEIESQTLGSLADNVGGIYVDQGERLESDVDLIGNVVKGSITEHYS